MKNRSPHLRRLLITTISLSSSILGGCCHPFAWLSPIRFVDQPVKDMCDADRVLRWAKQQTDAQQIVNAFTALLSFMDPPTTTNAARAFTDFGDLVAWLETPAATFPFDNKTRLRLLEGAYQIAAEAGHYDREKGLVNIYWSALLARVQPGCDDTDLHEVWEKDREYRDSMPVGGYEAYR